ncbi:MAG: hypothetical protein IJ730_01820 [Alphaproteobacteria bacterium]|nr:hypothetical protein [Alphaproteobacteria bacterium]
MAFFKEKDGKLVSNQMLEALPYLKRIDLQYYFTHILKYAKKYREMDDILEIFFTPDGMLNNLASDLVNSKNFANLTTSSDLRV